MATLQEYYRLTSRLPRYTNKLTAFSNGMYLTNQMIPEGYAKAMINYDIDDTGTNIRPRYGRTLVQTLDTNSKELGPIALSDYLYVYNSDKSEVLETADIVMSHGEFTIPSSETHNIPKVDSYAPLYVAKQLHTVDNNVYDLQENIVAPGDIIETLTSKFWAAYYDKVADSFKNIINDDVGSVAARTVSNAYAFDKPFAGVVGRPISVVHNNELIAFAGPTINYKEYPSNSAMNEAPELNSRNLCKLKFYKDEEGNTHIFRDPISTRLINILEAISAGYNMLAAEPYTFRDVSANGIDVLGIMMYDPEDDTIPILTPVLGQGVDYRLYHQYPSDTEEVLYVQVEVLDLTSDTTDWEVLVPFPTITEVKETDEETGEETVVETKVEGGWAVNPGEVIKYNYASKYVKFAIRFTLRKGTDTTTDVAIYRNVLCGDLTYNNVALKKFHLDTCKGMISWQGCVGLYGVEGALNTIFFSDTENPGYFPFPNNAITFDNDILAVHNYLDNLLVITVDSIWLVTPGATIIASPQTRIMANIHIPEIDAMNAVVLKDQIFFKTDTQFYVLKPNQYTSDATDLKNYVNSTAIANYTLNFKDETIRLFNQVYRNVWQVLTKELRKQIRFEDFDVLDTRSVIRNEEVHYIYTVCPILTDNIRKDKLNIHLVYNTLTRSWRMYFVAIGSSSLYAPILYKNKQSGVYYEFFAKDKLYITAQDKSTVSDAVEGLSITDSYDNFTYLDTGNVAIDDMATKRFREVQFNLMNAEPTTIDFYVDFKLDGQERVSATNYEMQHITDTADPDYGQIYITPVEGSNMSLPGMTTLADNITMSDHFALDLSKFPELSVATVRFRLQGRGRRACIQLLNTTLKRYELSDMNWAYRAMNMR